MVLGINIGITTLEKYVKAAEALEATALKLGGKAELTKLADQALKVKADVTQLDADLRALASELSVDFDLLVKDIK